MLLLIEDVVVFWNWNTYYVTVECKIRKPFLILCWIKYKFFSIVLCDMEPPYFIYVIPYY